MFCSVTVIGPPRAICSRNSDTTLPVESITLPNRTATQRVDDTSLAARHTCSASCLLAPITLTGCTALSVEISTKRSAPCRKAAPATTCVPSTFTRTASRACGSSIGTCLYAAA